MDIPNFDIIGQGISGGQPSGLLMGLDPKYQAAQLQNQEAQLALKRATAFQNGVPTNPDGSIDIDTIGRTQIQNGDAAGGLGLLLTGQKLALLRDPATVSNPTGQGGVAGGQRTAPAVAGQGSVGGGTLAPIDVYAHAIGSIESGNRYDALGPKQANGAQAIGRYQVMSSNVGPWTKEVLGTAMSPEDFRASPEAQDAVFRAKFGQSVQQYGSPFQAASIWFSGRPLDRAGNATDSLGTSVPGYIQKFAAALGPAAQALRGGQGAQPGAQVADGGQSPAAGSGAPEAAATPISFGGPASPAPTSGGTAAAGPAPVSDDMYATAKRVVAHFQNTDPQTMSLEQQRAVTRSTELISQYEGARNGSAGGQGGGASAGTVNGAPTSSTAAPPSNQHPFAPGSNAVTGSRTPLTPPAAGAPSVTVGAQPGNNQAAGAVQPISFGGAAPAVPAPQAVPPGRQPPQAGGAAPLGAMPPEVSAALQRLQNRQGSPADGAIWGAYQRSVGQGVAAAARGGQAGGAPAVASPAGPGLAARPVGGSATPAPPTGPDLPYLQGKYTAPGGGAQYVSDLLDTARRYGLAGEQQAAQAFETRAKQVQDDLAAINKSRLDLQTKNAELGDQQKLYRDAQGQGFTGSYIDFQNTLAAGKASANAAGRNATLTPGEKEYQQAVAGGFQGSQADYQASVAAQKAEAEGQGKFYGELPAKYAAAADAGRAANDNVDQMLTAAQGFRMGAGAGMQQDARKTLQGVMGFFGVSDPKLNDPTASFEDFGKMAGAHLRNVVSGISGPKGVQELQLVGSSLPSAEQSYDGFRAVSASLKGSNDFAIAKQQASQDWLADPAHKNSLSGFEASFNRNVSPSAFWLNRLRVDQPDLFSQAVQRLGATDQGRTLLTKAKAGMAWANKNGLFD